MQVIDCLVNLIGRDGCMVEDNGSIFLACDTILNLFLKVVNFNYIQPCDFSAFEAFNLLCFDKQKEQLLFPLDESTVAKILKALAYWTGTTY